MLVVRLEPGVIGVDGVGVVELVEAQSTLMGKSGGMVIIRSHLLNKKNIILVRNQFTYVANTTQAVREIMLKPFKQ